MSLWTAACHIQVETQRQRDLELVDESSCVLQQSKKMPTLVQSSEKRFNQMRNWEVGSGCHKRFYRHLLFWFIYRLLFWNFRHRLVRHYWYGNIGSWSARSHTCKGKTTNLNTFNTWTSTLRYWGSENGRQGWCIFMYFPTKWREKIPKLLKIHITWGWNNYHIYN